MYVVGQRQVHVSAALPTHIRGPVQRCVGLPFEAGIMARASSSSYPEARILNRSWAVRCLCNYFTSFCPSTGDAAVRTAGGSTSELPVRSGAIHTNEKTSHACGYMFYIEDCAREHVCRSVSLSCLSDVYRRGRTTRRVGARTRPGLEVGAVQAVVPHNAVAQHPSSICMDPLQTWLQSSFSPPLVVSL